MTHSGHDTDYWRLRAADDEHMDWRNGGNTWIEEYKVSVDHPHRGVIVNLLREFPWSSLLEVGCSSGPNLKAIHDAFPKKDLWGVDVNEASVKEGIQFMKTVPSTPESCRPVLHVASAHTLPFGDRSFDTVLLDAVLMYIRPDEIEQALSEVARVTRKAIIIVDRFNESLKGEVTGHVWGRNYPALLKNLGFTVESRKITEADWPESKNWQLSGYYFVGEKYEN